VSIQAIFAHPPVHFSSLFTALIRLPARARPCLEQLLVMCPMLACGLLNTERDGARGQEAPGHRAVI